VMAMVQTRWIPDAFGLERWYTWIIALAVGLALGALVGLFQGVLVGYVKIPSFIVTLGGLLIWRGLIFRFQQGQTLSPLDSTFKLIGGGPRGSLGDWKSWLVGAIACAMIILSVVLARRRRQRYELPLRPMWLDAGIGALGCLVVVASIGLVANKYLSPITEDPRGIAYPVVILIMVAILMTYLAQRRQFGRYVYAYGGNPEAAELGGINTRKVIMLTFALMGVLCAVSAAVQTARLDAAVTNLGVTNELDVISAAVIGGTSFAGGIGTIPGAVLGAVIMQSLRSGMVLLKIDSPTQDVVVGLVLILAVGLDSTLRKGAK